MAEEQNEEKKELTNPTKETNISIGEIHSDEWKKQFENFSEIPFEEAVAKLQAGEKLQELKIPYLNLDNKSFENKIVVERCIIDGIVARGSLFKKSVEFHHCLFTDRLQLSAQKEKESFIQTTFENDFKFHQCHFEKTFSMRTAEILGETVFEQCYFSKTVIFDKASFQQAVRFEGPGFLAFASMFRAKLKGGLFFQEQTIPGEEKLSLDLNQIQLQKKLVFKNCQLEKKLELKRASLENDTGIAWLVDNSTFDQIDIQESNFNGELNFSQVEIHGDFMADPPRESAGHKAGRATRFKRDVAFLESQFHKKCSFQNAKFLQYLNFKNCSLADGASFNQAEFGQVTSFWEVESNKGIHFRKARFQGRTQFGRVKFGHKSSFNESTFEEEFSLFDSSIQGDIYFTQAYFEKDIKIRGVSFEGGAGFQKISVDGDFSIFNSKTKDRFILTGSQLRNFIAPGLSIGTWGSLGECVIQGKVELNGLRVGEHLSSSEPLSFEGTPEIVPGSFYFTDSILHQDLQLSKARIEGKLGLEQLNTYAELDLTNLTIGDNLVLSKSYFRGLVRFDSTTCKSVESFKTRFKEEVSFNRLKCENFSLTGSSFDGGFTLRGGEIASTLILNEVDVDGKIDLFKCKFDRLFFQNLITDHFLIDRDSLGEMLASEKVKNYKQAKNEYGTLKQAFLQRSQYQDMDWAYYRFCRASRKEKEISLKQPIQTLKVFIDWLFLDKGFGYGTQPMRIGLMALAFILIFASIFCFVPGGIVGSSGKLLTKISFVESFYLSVVTFASMDYGDCYPSFDHWLKHLFSLEGLLGIFITTLFVATISRKIIRT